MKNQKLSNTLLAATLAFVLAPISVYAQQAVGNATPVSLGTPTAVASQATPATTPTTIGVPQGFSGIFSCNQNGSYAMSVGALGATGGVYVPVADATVELNTGTLVYKECVLREVVDAQRKAATAGFLKQAQLQIQTGRNNGGPLYAVNVSKDLTAVGTAAVQAALQNGTLSSLDPAIQNQIKQAIARGYVVTTYNAPSLLACPYPGAPSDFTSANSQAGIWNDILAVGSTCNPLFGYIYANDLVTGAAAQARSDTLTQLNWGLGFYSVTDNNADPLQQQILTPASIVKDSYSQVLTSPFRQLESANDLGQMVGALFAGISTQVLSGNGGGLAGLTQPIGNQPSYLDQAVAQTTQDLQGSIANAALANLTAALQVEQQYFNIMSAIAANLTDTIGKLRSGEQQCWAQLETHVCATSAGGNACADSNGDNLQIATSTAFSQAIVGSQIAPLASTTINNLKISQQALTLINNLIKGVTGASADAQAVAIEQLNSLIVNHQLHQQPDIRTAQSQQQSVQNAMQTLAQNTLQLWAGTNPNDSTQTNIPWDSSITPGTGWCNFQNQTTLQMWIQKWKV